MQVLQILQWLLRSLGWSALHAFVWFCPGLYWRSGAEMESWQFCDGSYTGPDGDKADPSTWKRFPITYRSVAEHHGLTKPKVCRFPSFTKCYATAAHYAEEGRLGRVHLVWIPRGAFWTQPIIEHDMAFNDMIYQAAGCIPSLRSSLSESYVYALRFSQLPGGVYICNTSYLPLRSFETVDLSPIIEDSFRLDNLFC